jgi:hypothetical protein
MLLGCLNHAGARNSAEKKQAREHIQYDGAHPAEGGRMPRLSVSPGV